MQAAAAKHAGHARADGPRPGAGCALTGHPALFDANERRAGMWESSWLGIVTTVAAIIARGLEHGLTGRGAGHVAGGRSGRLVRTAQGDHRCWPGYRSRRPWRAARVHAGCRSAEGRAMLAFAGEPTAGRVPSVRVIRARPREASRPAATGIPGRDQRRRREYPLNIRLLYPPFRRRLPHQTRRANTKYPPLWSATW